MGELKLAEEFQLKAIDLDSDLVKPFYSLSLLKNSYKNKSWLDKLFSNAIIENKNTDDLIDIYFAKANASHYRKNFKDSNKYLTLANNTKGDTCKYDINLLLLKSNKLMNLSIKQERLQVKKSLPFSLFLLLSCLDADLLFLNQL